MFSKRALACFGRRGCEQHGPSNPRLIRQPWKIFDRLNAEFERRYKDTLVLQPSLSRSLVSFQANKGLAVYR